MAKVNHWEQTAADGVHTVIAHVVPDAAALAALTTFPGGTAFGTADIGKVVQVSDDDSLWWYTGTGFTELGSGGGSPLTDAEIKTAYENNADTNAFTDAEKTKLGNLTSSSPTVFVTTTTYIIPTAALAANIQYFIFAQAGQEVTVSGEGNELIGGSLTQALGDNEVAIYTPNLVGDGWEWVIIGTAAVSATVSEEPVLTSGMTAQVAYKFNDAAQVGGLISSLSDFYTNNSDLTAAGVERPTKLTAAAGSAQFDGVTNFMRGSSLSELNFMHNPTTDWSFGMALQMDSDYLNGTTYILGNTGTGTGFRIQFFNGTFRFYVYGTADQNYQAVMQCDSSWQTIWVRCEKATNTLRFYANGVFFSEMTFDPGWEVADANQTFHVGGFEQGGTLIEEPLVVGDIRFYQGYGHEDDANDYRIWAGDSEITGTFAAPSTDPLPSLGASILAVGQSNLTNLTDNTYTSTNFQHVPEVGVTEATSERNVFGAVLESLEGLGHTGSFSKRAVSGASLSDLNYPAQGFSGVKATEHRIGNQNEKIDLCFMHIGITDAANAESQATMETYIEDFIAGFTVRPSYFIAVGPHEAGNIPTGQLATIRDAYAAVAARYPWFYYVPLDTIPGESGDEFHITAPANVAAARDLILPVWTALY